ncbi:hypothetical protein DFH27DRAFT_604945 [Peziza echinospora]|nr:hypothetical protein DFH27DRAFT_604945 [Peziza echinospora]
MADAVKKLFGRMKNTQSELKALQEALDQSNRDLAEARGQGQQREGGHHRSRSEEDSRGRSGRGRERDPRQGRDRRASSAGYRKRYDDLIALPLLAESPPPQPAPRDASILPIQDTPLRKTLPYSSDDLLRLPGDSDPLPTLPGTIPSRKNPEAHLMKGAYPNLINDESDRRVDRNLSLTPIGFEETDPKKRATVLDSPFTATEARNLLRLGWIALEFLRDDQRPCCIIEVNKNNYKGEIHGLANTITIDKASLGKGDTALIDASDPRTISMLMKEPERVIGGNPIYSVNDPLPRIMFENDAFLNVKRRLSKELPGALSQALETEPPRTIRSENPPKEKRGKHG